MSDAHEPLPTPTTAGAAPGTLHADRQPPPPQPGDAPPGSRGRRWAVVAAALVGALAAVAVTVPLTLALVGLGTEASDAPAAGEPPAAEPGGADIADIAEALLPSVARVDVAAPGATGSGSAVVYRADGYLLTNAHVVDQAAEVEVTLPDGTSLPAEVIGADAFNDLAVLRVDVARVPAGELPEPPFADGSPRIGETAIAIGSPFELDGSVTAGIVSGLGRAIPGTPLRDLVQTDAPINPGNSGGALVNGRGEVIGINTAILPDPASPGARGNIGIGFAIPMTNAIPIADQLIEHGFVQHAQLGVQAQSIDPRIAELYGLPVREGALVASVVAGSAADEAGLQRGDIITALGGEDVTNVLDLVAAIRAHEPGEDVEVVFWRAGEERTVTATLGAAEDGP